MQDLEKDEGATIITQLPKKKAPIMAEVRLPDGTRCDVETKTHAIEVDWAHKWYEEFAQSL